MSYAKFEASMAPLVADGLRPLGTTHDTRADAGVLPARAGPTRLAAPSAGDFTGSGVGLACSKETS